MFIVYMKWKRREGGREGGRGRERRTKGKRKG